MRTINIHDAKTQLSRLVEGEPFTIAMAGKPLVTLKASATSTIRRIGFMAGEIAYTKRSPMREEAAQTGAKGSTQRVRSCASQGGKPPNIVPGKDRFLRVVNRPTAEFRHSGPVLAKSDTAERHSIASRRSMITP